MLIILFLHSKISLKAIILNDFILKSNEITINYLLYPFLEPILGSIFFSFFALLKNDVYFEYTEPYEEMTVKEPKEFIFENYYRLNSFTEKKSYFWIKKKYFYCLQRN